ncbi:MAG: Flp pilus assembly complex ATPase component TadA [Candidatus Riflebacteria bacterium]|nr:Flp pilus assembly complex ATPase component TadA [Candidatus Riflebacteria bacterium]
MEQAAFKKSFPAFPIDEESINQLKQLLVKDGVSTDDELNNLQSSSKTPLDFVEAVAGLKSVTPEVLAKAESEILKVPYIKLDETQINNEIFKLIDVKIIKSKNIIPIKLNGAELMVGSVEPGNSDLFVGLHPSMAIKPAKVLGDLLESKIAQLTGSKVPRKKSHQRKRLGDILVDSKYCKPEQIDDAFKKAKEQKLRLGAYLVKNGIISNKQLSIALSKQYDIPFIDLDESLVDPVVGSLLTQKFCEDHILCPVKKENGKLVLAMTDPTDIITIDQIEMMTGMRVSPVVSSELSIMAALGNLFGESVDSLAEGIGGEEKKSEDDEGLGELNENDAPIIKLVNLILTQAVVLHVSDIHIEIYESEFRIRFRQDGTMKLFMTPAKAAHAGLVSRIKVMSNLDIAETRRPQDGLIKLNMQDRKIDLRVSCIPCVWGEKIVMRICDQGNLKVDLKDLGFEPFVLEKFMKGVQAPNGIVLVTGPTGSGKTTTLYSSLFLLNKPTENIMTAEDPVEYNLMGINQVQCHADIGLDFSAALRSFLRQDPDVIMLGEIRDFETASIAIKAAMTGHLVISTLHTNDAPATVARLLNMGIEPFSLSSSLRIVQAQRLVKRICKHCAEEYKPEPDLLQSLNIDEKTLKRLRLDDQYSLDTIVFHKGKGCEECDNTGLKGRQGIYEVLEVTPKFRELIECNATTEDMRRQAIKDGMLSLRESALYKLITGRTTVGEVVGTTVDAGGREEDDPSAKKPKMAEESNDKTMAAAQKAKEAAEKRRIEEEKEEASNQAPLQITTGAPVNVANVDALTKELHEFNSILAKVSSIPSNTSISNNAVVSDAILKSNIAAPLNAIKTYASKTTEAAKVLPIIQAQGQKMEHNVKNLITQFSEFAPKIGKFQINQLVEKEIFGNVKSHVVTARLLSGVKEIGKNLKLSKNLPVNLPPINVDTEAFSTIISNVFINSLIGLGAKGGEIKVVTRLKPKTNNIVELVIFDNGCGIPVEQQKNLFKPFGNAGKNSLGLGLAVAQKLLHALKGEITVKSTPNTSTLVSIELPAAA